MRNKTSMQKILIIEHHRLHKNLTYASIIRLQAIHSNMKFYQMDIANVFINEDMRKKSMYKKSSRFESTTFPCHVLKL